MDTPAPPRGSGRAHAAVVSTSDAAAGDRTDVPLHDPRPSGFAAVMARITTLLAWWNRTRAGRANARFGASGGGVLTGGIAYSAIFSLFAGLTLGYTVFMAVLGGNAELRASVLDAISSNLPGLIQTGGDKKSGLVDPESLVMSTGVSVTGVVAVVVLLVSATSAMSSLRTAVRAMFDEHTGGGNILTTKARDLAGFAGMALAILLSAVLSIATTTAADWLLGLVGLSDDTGIVVRVLGIAVALVVDAATFLLIVWVLGGLRPAWRDLWRGALIAGVGLGVVRVLGTSVVTGSVGRNALLASFAVIVTLLVWINLIARIVLLAAAWTADPPQLPSGDDAQAEPSEGGAPDAPDAPDRPAAVVAAPGRTA